MPYISPWLDLMNNTVTVELLTGLDPYGVATYAASATYPARVNNSSRRVLNKDGEEVVARGSAIVASPGDIPTNARITLDDGSKPLILSSNSEPDEDGGHLYSKFYFS